MAERLLTARELANYLGLAPATILDKWERGELPGFKFGRAVRFDLAEVLATGRPDAGRHAPANHPRPVSGTVRSASEPKEGTMKAGDHA